MEKQGTLVNLRAGIPAPVMEGLEAAAARWGLPVAWATRQALEAGLKAINRPGWTPVPVHQATAGARPAKNQKADVKKKKTAGK